MPEASKNGHAKPRGCLEYISHVIESSMNSFFCALGRIVARNPWKTLAIALVVSVIGMGGASMLEQESRGDKLWVPTGTRSQEDYATYLTYFRGEGRENLAIVVPLDGGNVLTKENLIKSMEYFQDLSNITINYEGVMYSFEDLCVTSSDYRGTNCQVESVLGKWEYVISELEDDDSIIDTINNGSTVNELEKFLGGPTLSEDGSRLVEAEALRIMLLLKNTQTVVNGEYVDPIPDAWELEFIDEAQECVEGMECFIEAARSLNDEFGGAIQGDIALISGSYMIILAYAIINLSGRPLLRSRVMLSIGAILTVGLSIAVSIGVASYLGFFYTPLHTVLPFVLLGLGVDDSFVICNAFGNTDPRKSITDRMSESLGHSGVSITVTSITDFVAFMISSSTALPALESFCVYSALGVLALYILQSTVFVAFVVFDARRQEAGRLDIVPCFKTKNMTRRPRDVASAAVPPGEEWDPKKGERGYLQWFVSEVFAPFLTNKLVKAGFILMFAVVLGFSIYGATQLEVKDTGESFIPDGSYLLDTNAAVEKYFGGVGADVEIVTTDIDYFASQADLADVASQLTGFEDKSPYIQDPVTSGTFFSWFDDLIEFAEANGSATLVESGGHMVFGVETEFYSFLSAFLRTPEGARYESSVVMTGPTTINAAAIQTEYSGDINGEASKQVDALEDLRSLVDGLPFEAFPWSESYLTWETFRVIFLELYQGLGLCLGAVLILTLILIAHPLTAFLVFACVAFTIIDVLGIMYYWGLAIDTVAVIQLVLAVGLSVDYAAHVGHSFMLKAGTRDERMVQALSDIGVAVIHGGISTFLAVVLLSLSSSYVFRVLFKQFFSTAVMGLGHGLILLPIMLSLIGPASYIRSAGSSPSKEEEPTATSLPQGTAKIAESGVLP